MSLQLGTRLRAAADRNAFVGMVAPWAGVASTAPYGWLFCYGQNVSRTTYAALFAALVRSATVTITIASPGVVSFAAHGLGAGDPVVFRTTGALPTGLTAGTVYYVLAAGLAAGSFRVAATPGGAAINTSGTQSGVHTGWYAPYGDGDGSTTFGIPDGRGRFIAGMDDMGGTSANRLTGLAGGVDGDVLGATGGEEAHVNTIAETAAHDHGVGPAAANTAIGGASNRLTGVVPLGTGVLTTSTGGGGGHNTVPPVIVFNTIIFAGV